MRLTELDYDLPPELVAQEPLERRDDARMLVLDRRAGAIEHSRFYKLGRYLREGDLLVLNDTRVFPARLFARKATGGAVELLMVRPADEPPGAWMALIRGHRAIARGHAAGARGRPRAADRRLSASRPSVVVSDDGRRSRTDPGRAPARWRCRTISIASPEPDDRADYQTVYAEQTGRGRRADRRAAFHAGTAGQSWPTAGVRTACRDAAYRAGHLRAGAQRRGRGAYDGGRMVHDSARRAATRSSWRGAPAGA